MRRRLQQALLAEAPEKAVEAASLLLDLAELLLNQGRGPAAQVRGGGRGTLRARAAV